MSDQSLSRSQDVARIPAGSGISALRDRYGSLADETRDRLVALTLAAAAGAVYAMTPQPDWHFDSFRLADFLQRGLLESLLRVLHVLGNLLSLGLYRGLRAAGLSLSSLSALGVVNVAGAAAAVGVTFLAARRLGGSARTAAVSAGVLGVSLGAWRAAGRMTIYGIALSAIALAWLTLARIVQRPSRRSTLWAGAACGLAMTSHLGAVTLLPGALLILLGNQRLALSKRLGNALCFGLGALGASILVLVPAAGVAKHWSKSGMWDWFAGPQFHVADNAHDIGFGLRGLVQAVAGAQVWAARSASLTAALGVLGSAAIVLLAMGRGFRLLRRTTTRAVAFALLLHASMAILGAAWFVSTHSDYFSLALIPLVLLWAAGGRLDRTGSPLQRRLLLASGAAFVVALAFWNFWSGIRPSLRQAQIRGDAAASIVRVTPPKARVLLSPFIAPRVAYAGLDAETGWSALSAAVRGGARGPGLEDIIGARGPLLV